MAKAVCFARNSIDLSSYPGILIEIADWRSIGSVLLDLNILKTYTTLNFLKLFRLIVKHLRVIK